MGTKLGLNNKSLSFDTSHLRDFISNIFYMCPIPVTLGQASCLQCKSAELSVPSADIFLNFTLINFLLS